MEWGMMDKRAGSGAYVAWRQKSCDKATKPKTFHVNTITSPTLLHNASSNVVERPAPNHAMPQLTMRIVDLIINQPYLSNYLPKVHTYKV